MEQATRNKLRNVVTQCRKLLEESIAQQLQGQFGIYAGKKDAVQVEDEARMAHLSDEDRQYRRDLLDHFEHIEARGFKPKDALDQLVREIAFTHLNRLCAYKMMEARDVYVGGHKFREAVSRGINSNGFKFYLADHPEDERLFSTGQQELAYRHFLDWLGGLLSEEIGILFSPNDPANRLYPRQKTLDELLALLNDEDLAGIWEQDETIGWVYQYFTPKELRDQARKESQAPRNSYELAFRNQFFTPRYVVEFLTDNTLGRIWYEMRKGDTKLTDQCRYMVRRPNEIFLDEGQEPPTDATEDRDDVSQEDLLKQPMYVLHREKKDPRELKILDPACGSGHFLLYCFDLLQTIYEEAYNDQDVGPAFQQDYATLDDLRRDVPRLILAHNVHGIDIDLRCTQIAALALWLRCQRAYQEMGQKGNRPKITRSNFVCAEPMPGEEGLLDEFLKTLREDRLERLIRRVLDVAEGKPVRATPEMADRLCELVRLVWDKMKLAGEAGSLLKIEEELQEAIRKGQEEWEESQPLFRISQYGLTEEPQEKYIRFIPGEGVSFWERAEALVMAALDDFGEYAANGRKLLRKLFVDDAMRGFAFVDVCRQRFDVVLMNPPFGQGTAQGRSYLSEASVTGHEDLGMATVAVMTHRLAEGGFLGAITSRTYAAIPTARAWRDDVLFGYSRLSLFADLGYNVLDTAMVEAASYVITRSLHTQHALFISALESKSKQAVVERAVHATEQAVRNGTAVVHRLSSFTSVPGHVLCYWLDPQILAAAERLPNLGTVFGEAKSGLNTGDDFRFLRLVWEVPSHSLGTQTATWALCCKGGEYEPFFDDVDIALKWAAVPDELLTLSGARVFNTTLNFRSGVVYPMRTTSDISPRLLAPNCCFNKGAQFIDIRSHEDAGAFIAMSYTRPFKMFVEALYGGGDVSVSGSAAKNYTGGVINGIPVPEMTEVQKSILYNKYMRAAKAIIGLKKYDELSRFFCSPVDSLLLEGSLDETAQNRLELRLQTKLKVGEVAKAIDDEVLAAYGFPERAKEAIRTRWGEHPYAYARKWSDLSTQDHERFYAALEQMCSSQWSSDEQVEGSRRLLTKKGFFSDRMVEVLAHTFSMHPSAVAEAMAQDALLANRERDVLCREVMSFAIGCAVGRWDVRAAAHAWTDDDIPSPFDALPIEPPGSVKGTGGCAKYDAPADYPLVLDWDGILVDDPGNQGDIVRRVREVFEVIWKDRADSIEKEGCEILGVKSLRDYFRKPGKGGFWDDHVKRYSKSRRKAPIYWLLQSSKKNYALWLYYHRLDKDMLFKALLNYVEPKIQREENRLGELRSQKASAGEAGKGAKKLDRDIEKQEDLLTELRDFEEKLRKVGNMHLVPDLNDGVVLNIAPLHEVVPWKEAKKYWTELLEGKYEWSSMGKQLREKGIVK